MNKEQGIRSHNRQRFVFTPGVILDSDPISAFLNRPPALTVKHTHEFSLLPHLLSFSVLLSSHIMWMMFHSERHKKKSKAMNGLRKQMREWEHAVQGEGLFALGNTTTRQPSSHLHIAHQRVHQSRHSIPAFILVCFWKNSNSIYLRCKTIRTWAPSLCLPVLNKLLSAPSAVMGCVWSRLIGLLDVKWLPAHPLPA